MKTSIERLMFFYENYFQEQNILNFSSRVVPLSAVSFLNATLSKLKTLTRLKAFIKRILAPIGAILEIFVFLKINF